MDIIPYKEPPLIQAPIHKSMLQHIAHNLQNIFRNTESPEKIYAWCHSLTNICRNEFLTHTELYKNEKDSTLYVNTIRSKVEKIMKQKHIVEAHEFISNHLGVSAIPGDEMKNIDANLIHQIKSDLLYSIEHMTISFALTKKHTEQVLKRATPIKKEFIQNWLTILQNDLEYYELGDIILKYHPKHHTFYYDIIAIIKETTNPDTSTIDPLQTRKLIGITKPFVSSNQINNVKTPGKVSKQHQYIQGYYSG